MPQILLRGLTEHQTRLLGNGNVARINSQNFGLARCSTGAAAERLSTMRTEQLADQEIVDHLEAASEHSAKSANEPSAD